MNNKVASSECSSAGPQHHPMASHLGGALVPSIFRRCLILSVRSESGSTSRVLLQQGESLPSHFRLRSIRECACFGTPIRSFLGNRKVVVWVILNVTNGFGSCTTGSANSDSVCFRFINTTTQTLVQISRVDASLIHSKKKTSPSSGLTKTLQVYDYNPSRRYNQSSNKDNKSPRGR